MLSYKSTRYCQILIGFHFFLQIFEPSNIRFHENPSSGSQNGHADGHEVKSFRFAANASKDTNHVYIQHTTFSSLAYGNFLDSKSLPSRHD